MKYNIYTWCARVKIGVHGRVWVHIGALGCGGHGEHKTNQTGGNYGPAGPDLGPMTGEISPNIFFFCKTKEKGLQTAPDGLMGFAWVQWGVFAQGGQENKEK